MQVTDFVNLVNNLDQARTVNDKATILKDAFGKFAHGPSGIESLTYLLQGRLDETYRARKLKRQPDQSNLAERLSEIRELHTQVVESDNAIPGPRMGMYRDGAITQLYSELHESLEAIDNWLASRGRAPRAVSSWCARFHGDDIHIFARLLVGPLVNDRVILLAISRLMKKALGAKDLLISTYKHTLPDLGKLLTTLRAADYDPYVLNYITIEIGIPVRPQEIAFRLSPEQTFAEIGPCFVQPKSDGLQCQIHVGNGRVSIFNRSLDNWTAFFPDIVRACQNQFQSGNAVFDCEIVGFDKSSNKIVPKAQTLMFPDHRALIFDLMLLDDIDWRTKEYALRRRELNMLLADKTDFRLSLVPEEFAGDSEALATLYYRWTEHSDYEGIVAIDPKGKYRNASRTQGKVKLKKYVSFEFAVLGYELSEKNVPIITVGLWETEAMTRLVPVGIVEGTIANDNTQLQLRMLFEELTVNKRPKNVAADYAPRNWVVPEIVVEVVFDGRPQPSSRFAIAGRELRNKKKLEIRDDLNVLDIDFLDDFQALELVPGYG